MTTVRHAGLSAGSSGPPEGLGHLLCCSTSSLADHMSPHDAYRAYEAMKASGGFLPTISEDFFRNPPCANNL